MDERANRAAALANAATYDASVPADYADGAPHLKHRTLRELYGRLVVGVYDHAARFTTPPRVLDLGAGEGSATVPFLDLGAHVTAVDVSKTQLEALKTRCTPYVARLEVRCQDVFEAIESLRLENNVYDIVTANSFLHHIPDYLALIRAAITMLAPHGQFFSFQDPLRYDSLGRCSLAFSNAAYLSWRVFKGDLAGAVKRKLLRRKGVFVEEDNVEYHVKRNGVDQDAIAALFNQQGFRCDIVRYFSTQSRLWQPVGALLRLDNTFGVVARSDPQQQQKETLGCHSL